MQLFWGLWPARGWFWPVSYLFRVLLQLFDNFIRTLPYDRDEIGLVIKESKAPKDPPLVGFGVKAASFACCFSFLISLTF